MGCESSVMEDSDDEHDSTWDDEKEEGNFSMTGVNKQWTRTAYRNLRAARDMQRYRHMCQKKTPASHGQENLYFYRNIYPSRPDGVYIEEYHKNWFGDYTRLETAHSYIQWRILIQFIRHLQFPIQEPGVNSYAHVLSLEEIQHFHSDTKLKNGLLKSYKLMLDFYGIQLVNKETGEVQRAPNWKERFENLNRNLHNNLRITRILKCLGILGFQHYQKPLVHFFLTETLVKGTLSQVKQSALDYFMFAVLNRSERKELIKYAFLNYRPKEEFVWCPRRIQRQMHRQPDYKWSARKSRAQNQKGPRHSRLSTQNWY